VYQANAFVLKAAAFNPRSNHGPGFQPDEAFERQPLVMERAVVDAAAHAIAGYCAKFHQPKARIVFAGDGPTFAGPDWFRHAMKVFRGQMPSGCATTFILQSDGKLLDENWLDLCAEMGISLTITLDSRMPAHANGFVNTGGARASLDALAAIESIRRHGKMESLFGGVVCVANPSDDGAALYRHFRSLGVSIMDFVLPTEANWDHPPAGFTSPTPYADYLISVFDEWWNENHPDVRIAFFDSLLRSMVGSRVHSDSLGADPLTTVVVDRNGNIEPVDSLCGSGAGQADLNVASHSIECIFQQPTFQKALAGQESLSQTCRKCEIRDVCGGGYLPSRFSQWNGFDNPSIYCADLSKLVSHVLDSCTRRLTATA
jgi:uncharacterized protein